MRAALLHHQAQIITFLLQNCLRNAQPLKQQDYRELRTAAEQYQVIKQRLPQIRQLTRCGFLDDAFRTILNEDCQPVKRDIWRCATGQPGTISKLSAFATHVLVIATISDTTSGAVGSANRGAYLRKLHRLGIPCGRSLRLRLLTHRPPRCSGSAVLLSSLQDDHGRNLRSCAALSRLSLLLCALPQRPATC